MKANLSLLLLSLALAVGTSVDSVDPVTNTAPSDECEVGETGECLNTAAAAAALDADSSDETVAPIVIDKNCPDRGHIIKCAGRHLDTNRNGKLDRIELEAAAERLPWYGRGIVKLLGSTDKMMKKCDMDKDDAISMDYDMLNNQETCLSTCFKRRAFKQAFFPDCTLCYPPTPTILDNCKQRWDASRYKKVKKSLVTSNGGGDYFDTVGVWGLGDSGRRPKKRSQTAVKLRALKKKPAHNDDAFDVAPEADDFALTDLFGSLKRESIPALEAPDVSVATALAAVKPKLAPSATVTTGDELTPSTTIHSTPAIDDAQEKLLKKFERQIEPDKPVVSSESRMPGESKRAYSKRVKLETRQIIQRANKQSHNPEKRQKKKDFLNQKKKRKRSAAGYDDEEDDIGADQEDHIDSTGGKLLTGEQAVAERARATQVQFGEQAERPPTFQQLPRGAKKAKQSVATGQTQRQNTKHMNDAEIEADRQTMDLMRRKVQAQYAAIKLRRKQNGDFHL